MKKGKKLNKRDEREKTPPTQDHIKRLIGLSFKMIARASRQIRMDLLSEKDVEDKDNANNECPDTIHGGNQRVVEVKVTTVKGSSSKRGQDLVADQR